MGDDWFIADAEDHTRSARTFSHDHAVLFCFELERDPERKGDVSTIWDRWPR